MINLATLQGAIQSSHGAWFDALSVAVFGKPPGLNPCETRRRHSAVHRARCLVALPDLGSAELTEEGGQVTSARADGLELLALRLPRAQWDHVVAEQQAARRVAAELTRRQAAGEPLVLDWLELTALSSELRGDV